MHASIGSQQLNFKAHLTIPVTVVLGSLRIEVDGLHGTHESVAHAHPILNDDLVMFLSCLLTSLRTNRVDPVYNQDKEGDQAF